MKIEITKETIFTINGVQYTALEAAQLYHALGKLITGHDKRKATMKRRGRT